jgi:hypothetical protein
LTEVNHLQHAVMLEAAAAPNVGHNSSLQRGDSKNLQDLDEFKVEVQGGQPKPAAPGALPPQLTVPQQPASSRVASAALARRRASLVVPEDSKPMFRDVGLQGFQGSHAVLLRGPGCRF